MAMESPESRAPGAAPPDRRVLFLAYEYPPLGGVGIVRTTQFAKYLPRCGWQPSVLTVQNPDRFYTTEGGDRGPRGVTVHRAFNPLNNLSVVEGGLRRLRLDRKVFVPDVYGGWAWSAARVGTDLVRREEISVVYATCPPYSTALAGARIATTTGVPLVVDLRDAWTLSPYAPSYLFPWQRRREERLETVVLETAAHVVTATDAIREDYERTYPEIRDRISTVLNGFDPELLPARVQPFPRFTIAYTGFFYGAQSPESFLDALSVVLHEHRVPPGDLHFVWAGRDAPFVRQLARDRGLEEVVEYLGLLPKPEADAPPCPFAPPLLPARGERPRLAATGPDQQALPLPRLGPADPRPRPRGGCHGDDTHVLSVVLPGLARGRRRDRRRDSGGVRPVPPCRHESSVGPDGTVPEGVQRRGEDTRARGDLRRYHVAEDRPLVTRERYSSRMRTTIRSHR